jgi:hypothetical protein
MWGILPIGISLLAIFSLFFWRGSRDTAEMPTRDQHAVLPEAI